MGIRLGDIAPDFEQDSSAGTIRFHQWLGDSWGVLFSPAVGSEVIAFVKSTEVSIAKL